VSELNISIADSNADNQGIPWIQGQSIATKIRDAAESLSAAMKKRKILPDQLALSSGVVVAGLIGDGQNAMYMYEEMKKKGLEAPAFLAEDMYSVIWRHRREVLLEELVKKPEMVPDELRTMKALIRNERVTNAKVGAVFWLNAMRNQGMVLDLDIYNRILAQLSVSDTLDLDTANLSMDILKEMIEGKVGIGNRTYELVGSIFASTGNPIETLQALENMKNLGMKMTDSLKEFQHFTEVRAEKLKRGEVDTHTIHLPNNRKIMTPMLALAHILCLIRLYKERFEEMGPEGIPSMGLFIITGRGVHSMRNPGVNREIIMAGLMWLGIPFTSLHDSGSLRISKTTFIRWCNQYNQVSKSLPLQRVDLKEQTTNMRLEVESERMPLDLNEGERTKWQIKSQIEYYFSEKNLQRDKFLVELIYSNDGWVSIEKLATFPRMRKLLPDQNVGKIAYSIQESLDLQLNSNRTYLRRRNLPKTFPSLNASALEIDEFLAGIKKLAGKIGKSTRKARLERQIHKRSRGPRNI